MRYLCASFFASVLVSVLAVACVVQPAPAPAPAPATNPAPAPDNPSPPPVENPASTPANGAPGSACTTSRDCDGGICEGLGCGEGQGVCAPRDRKCTTDARSYCGCDGRTFAGSSTCPNKRYARVGSCEQKLSTGAACSTASDCQSGICEGQGCGPGQGMCAEKKRMCTRDLATYCGCDGVTFQASGSCPGRRFSANKACEAASAGAPAGASCNTGADCASGACEGQGCGPNQGVCVPKNRACTRDLRAYCGCDGQTFRGSGSCPGKRYRKRGAC